MCGLTHRLGISLSPPQDTITGKNIENPNEVDLYQFMGKDNIPFHTVLFPSSLIGKGENWTLLKTIAQQSI